MELDGILALERRVWSALIAGDPDADRELLSEQFLGVYPTGYSDRESHAALLTAGPTVADYRIENARLMPLAPDTFLLVYLAHYSQPAEPGVENSMYVSSIWQEHGGRWLNIFSQDAPVSDISPP